MRGQKRFLALAALCAAAGLTGAATSPAPAQPEKGAGPKVMQDTQKAGDWLVRVERRAASKAGRAIPYQQTVLRQGPNDPEPVQLFQETSTGRVGVRLRDDGLLLVQPIGARARLYFHGSKEPVELRLPPPKNWKHPGAPYETVGRTWFLDDVLFYDRLTSPGQLIGFVRIDAQKQAVAPGRILLQVDDGEADPQRVYGDAVFRAGDYVLWTNTGYHNSFYPDAVRGTWKSRRVRAFNLSTGELLDPDKVPAEVLKENRERLLAFVEKQAHNKSPELEAWAVRVLGRVGTPKDAERLLALYRTIRECHIEDENGNIVSDERRMRARYRAALKALGKEVNP